MNVPVLAVIEEDEEKQIRFHVHYDIISNQPQVTILKGNTLHSTCRGIETALKLAFELGLQIGSRKTKKKVERISV